MSYSMSKGIKVLKQNSLFDEFQINGKINKNTLAIKLKYENNNIDKSDLQKNNIMLGFTAYFPLTHDNSF